jgi:hypothetical protein
MPRVVSRTGSFENAAAIDPRTQQDAHWRGVSYPALRRHKLKMAAFAAFLGYDNKNQMDVATLSQILKRALTGEAQADCGSLARFFHKRCRRPVCL